MENKVRLVTIRPNERKAAPSIVFEDPQNLAYLTNPQNGKITINHGRTDGLGGIRNAPISYGFTSMDLHTINPQTKDHNVRTILLEGMIPGAIMGTTAGSVFGLVGKKPYYSGEMYKLWDALSDQNIKVVLINAVSETDGNLAMSNLSSHWVFPCSNGPSAIEAIEKGTARLMPEAACEIQTRIKYSDRHALLTCKRADKLQSRLTP